MQWIFIGLILLVPLLAQLKVSATYNKYKKIDNQKGITGAEAARIILDKHNLKDMYVVEVQGNLTDHYDPTRKVIRLSKDIFHGTSQAALAIAAHECGHAIQHNENYSFMKIRSLLFPVVKIATKFSYIVIFIGILSQILNLILIGIALVATGLLFQLVTLPVEFDASKRANAMLSKLKLVSKNEELAVKEMLGAAAMTYVAGVLASALELVRLLLIFGGNRD